MEKFDFSKIEEQKKFDNLPEKEREKIVDEAHGEAQNIKEEIRNFLLSLYEGNINQARMIKREYSIPTDLPHIA